MVVGVDRVTCGAGVLALDVAQLGAEARHGVTRVGAVSGAAAGRGNATAPASSPVAVLEAEEDEEKDKDPHESSPMSRPQVSEAAHLVEHCDDEEEGK